MLNSTNFSIYSNPQLLSLRNTKPAQDLSGSTLASTSTLSTSSLSTSTSSMNLSNILASLGGTSFTSLLPSIKTTLNSAATQLLKQPPFAPSNVNLFTPQVYSAAPALQPAAARTYTNTDLTNIVKNTLTNRSGSSSSPLVQQGLATFNDPQLSQIVPDPRLRAGLATLQGTAGQGAIDAIKGGAFSSVSFGALPDNIGDVYAVSFLPNGATKPQIIVNQKFQYEDPRLLGVALAHEALHQDGADNSKEELVANSVESLVYGQQLLASPSLASSGTELARRFNTKLMARVNDRDANGNLRLLSSPGNLYPGGTALQSFSQPFSPLGADTPGNPYLDSVISKITGQPASNIGFSDAAVNLLDQNQKLLSPAEVVGLAAILRLQILPKA